MSRPEWNFALFVEELSVQLEKLTDEADRKHVEYVIKELKSGKRDQQWVYNQLMENPHKPLKLDPRWKKPLRTCQAVKSLDITFMLIDLVGTPKYN